MADNNSDYRITLLQQIFRAEALFGRDPAAPEMKIVPEPKAPDVIARPARASESSSPAERVAPQRQLKTAAELAEMIELDLAQHPDCPKAGFRVTVYGGSHWRAMLTITPAAGGIRDPKKWRDLTNDFAERLRKGYDLAWEQ